MPTPPSALDIARALVAFPSVTPDDAGALAYVQRLLAAAGFAVEIVAFAEAGTPTIANLWARFGRDAPNFVFAGHTDVVPPGDAARWRFDPFSATLADGALWGRGVADMKGGVAAALAAALRFVARGAFNGSISFLLTGDEEGPAVNGTVKLHRLGAKARRAFRRLPARRADQPGDARRHDQARPARLAQRPADAASASRAMSPIRNSPTIRSARWRRARRAAGAAARFRHGRLRPLQSRDRQRRRRQSGDQRHSRRSAPRLQRALQRPLDAGDARRRDRAARRRGGEGRALCARPSIRPTPSRS